MQIVALHWRGCSDRLSPAILLSLGYNSDGLQKTRLDFCRLLDFRLLSVPVQIDQSFPKDKLKMHVATDFDDDHAGKLTYIQKQTNQNIVEILNQAIDLYY